MLTFAPNTAFKICTPAGFTPLRPRRNSGRSGQGSSCSTNRALLGCFHPCHGCIDNAIHSAAGLQLRAACHRLMEAQGHDEPTGQAKITPGYDLPAKYVLHTVGPIVQNTVTPQDRAALTSCYRSCLTLAAERSLQTVAFCCISTGEFHFPPDEAARIAVETVIDFLQTPSSIGSLVWGTTPPASSNTPSGG